MTQQKGYSLLEVLMVMVIVTIIASLSYPVYASHITRVKRQQAQMSLLTLAHRLEEYYSLEQTFQNAQSIVRAINSTEENPDYIFVASQLTPQHFTIEAIPQGAQAQRDRQCGTLSLNDHGQRGSNSNNDGCW